MASLSVSIDIDPEIGAPSLSDDVISAWVEARLNDARNIFIQRMSRGGGSGRLYRHGRRTVHRASAEHEYPATDSGRLVNSVDYEMRGPREGALVTQVEYAKFLTEGTAHMAARRMLADALAEALENRPQGDALARAARIE